MFWHVVIRYFIPEDGDSETYPNVFLAPKPRQSGLPPTLGEVKHAFPLPGRYHFRFKAPLTLGGDREKNPVAVWMDCVDEKQTIPVWKNTIVAKVTRIGVEEDELDDDDEDFRRPQETPPAAAPTPAAATPAGPLLDVFDGSAAPPAVPPAAPKTAPLPNMGDLLGAPAGSAPAPAAAAAAAAAAPTGGGLLDMDSPPVYQGSHGSHANDFLGMTATPPTPATPQQYGQYGAQPTPQTGIRPPPQAGAQVPRAPGSGNAFDSFGSSNQQGPFGGLGTPWKQ